MISYTNTNQDDSNDDDCGENNNAKVIIAVFILLNFYVFAQQRQLVDMEDGCADVSLLDCIYCPEHTKQGEHFYAEGVSLVVSLRRPVSA